MDQELVAQATLDQQLKCLISQVSIVSLDLDGTLVDSFDRNYQATNLFLESRKFGPVLEEWVQENVMPNSVPTILEQMKEQLGFPVRSTDHALYESFLVEAADLTTIMPGAIELLSYFKNEKKNIALVTNCSRLEARGSCELLENKLGYNPFDVVATRNLFKEPKPSPEFMNYVFSELKLPSTTPYAMIGDSLVDVQLTQRTNPPGSSIFIGDKYLNVMPSFHYKTLQAFYTALTK